MLWFAGLHGAVAYACVRDFPDDGSGTKDIFVAATMVIVLTTIILMGGTAETLLDAVGIQTNVDEEAYMREWYKARKLKGAFHDFERAYLYSAVVREEDGTTTDDTKSQVTEMTNVTPPTPERNILNDSFESYKPLA